LIHFYKRIKMDVSEITSFKPSNLPRVETQEEEPEDDDSFESQALKRKLARKRALEIAAKAESERAELEERAAKVARKDGLTQSEKEKIEEMLEQNEEAAVDETGVKKIILQFEKKALKNQETRIKFPDQPEKFMESEMELHTALQNLHTLAIVPDFYPIIVDLNCVPSMLGLLSHDNSDIAVACLDLIQELTDVDTMTGSEEGAESLIQALIDNQIFSLMIACIERLDESVKEEAEGVHNGLAIIENIIEFRPAVAEDVAEAGFMSWLIKKLKVKVPFDANKLYASEILSILLQNEPNNRTMFGELGAIDSLLQQLAYYKRYDPAEQEEFEFMQNLFNCLCALMEENDNRDRFLQGEGIQLMNLMLREKKKSRSGALRVLDHALNGNAGVQNCMKFVEILGLRTIFPLFMKTPKKAKRAGLSRDEHQEHAIEIIASLLKNCSVGNGASKHRERILNKFKENDHEKVDRLLELHDEYYKKVERSDRQWAKTHKGTKLTDYEIYLRRCSDGLYVLQFIDFIILEICCSAASTVKQRVLQILNLRGGTLKTVRDVVREFAGNLGLDEDDPHIKVDKEYLLNLVDKF